MTDPIDRKGLRDRFWETIPMTEMTEAEWEALCDGCGRCCLFKFEDEDTREVVFTRVACPLMNCDTCHCGDYKNRKNLVPDCVSLTADTMKDTAYFMPKTCAYRLLHEGKPLFDWHPLVSGSHQSVHDAGVSIKGWTVNGHDISEKDWKDIVIEDDT